MRERTTIDPDMHLLAEAAVAFESTHMTETIHAALRQVVDARRRLGLLGLAPDWTLESLALDRRERISPLVSSAAGPRGGRRTDPH